uniref:Neurotransmitter-gated ion-channel ligand-binding domain-containing protein n=1 Tax=Plectus sambesii TaxID=2011161 RepID=A0A914W1P9_9BILA
MPYWQDEFLQWNPKDYEGAKEIFLSSTDIWVPEISLYYSHHFNEEVVLSSNNDVRLNYTGNLRYYIPFSTESLCKLDVKFFPFDIQSCRLLFGSWAHSNESLAFRLYEKNLSLIDFYDNQEWQLDVTASKVKEESWLYDYLDPPLFWDMIIVDLVVSRQSFYYVFNLVIPSTIITLVAVIGFHMPSTSGRVRDAKFRLGIMTLMSMSVILLAIVEDMPKFSMHGSTQRRGSFSGIPLIGLYYFILLAITGLSTVTTSMFVFLERDVRVSHEIPWYLRWLAFDLTSHITRTFSYHRASRHDEITDNQGSTPRQNLRKRLSLAHYDNMIMYQYFNQVLEDLLTSIIKIEQSLYGIRHELLSLLPRDDLNFKWNKVINRLEYLSLFFYCSLIFMTVMLFFFHGWYCSIGHSACNELNLKCPWMTVHPNDPSCQAA